MTAVDWARVDAAAAESIDQSVLSDALERGTRRGAASARSRLLVRRVVTIAAIVVLTAAGLVVRGLVHADPPLVVAGIAPTSGFTTGGEVVTITGTGLAQTTTVRFGSADAQSIQIDSDTQLTVTTPPSEPGAVEVTVIGTSASGSLTFTYVEPSVDVPAPVVLAISPPSGPSAGGDRVTLSGTGLGSVTSVRFGTRDAPDLQIDSDTQITVTTPAGEPGAVDVTVTSSAGTSTAPRPYTYVAPAPVVTEVRPPSGPRVGGEEVSIRGTGLLGTTSVRFGTVEALDFSVVSASQITATTPASDVPQVQVTVTTPAGTAAAPYTYTGDPPTLTSIKPEAECTNDDGEPQQVTLSGEGLAEVTDVWFGEAPATRFAPLSDTELVATPPAFTGVVTVTVQSLFGRSVDGVTYARDFCVE
ncbi:IPT/TIG domain-containing protein [Cellulomonas sp. Leaf334]|uniref:IPT/TIG domain-containing protein n=1 Tax=Cellulomonas sp. Leaf334 TaxID=1736339 RepID=UPI0006FC3E56|nr:IPT/TIG domain-containing protein [Cellulomonas sp. Leaf334]KQR07195.1 hypothetical protein ASF78_21760 [Cellulomonas sp. Leaf334]